VPQLSREPEVFPQGVFELSEAERPRVVTLRSSDRRVVFAEMAVFLAILVAGYVYVWWRGALEWD